MHEYSLELAALLADVRAEEREACIRELARQSRGLSEDDEVEGALWVQRASNELRSTRARSR